MKLRFILLLSLFLLFSLISTAQQSRVLVLEIDGPITQGVSEKISGAIEKCERENFEALIITINTDGGSVSALFSMVDVIENSEIPVIGHVTGRAFSAGALLLVACDVASMKPFTVLGSAHPVAIGFGGTQPIEDNKTINAIAEYAEAKAKAHNRDGDVARKFVTENLDLIAEEALELNVIDFVAEDINELLIKADGFESSKGIIYTKNVAVEEYNAPFITDILDFLGDPNISSILILVGVYALIFGLVSPGYGAEIVGALCLLLGLIGAGFNINYLALILLILGGVLLIFELVTPEFGILGVSGIIIMALGGMFIIPLNTEWYISSETMNSLVLAIIAVSVFLALFLAFAIYKVLQARKRKVVFAMEGEKAKASEDLDPEGLVVYDGEYWKAKSNSGNIKKGEDVIIVGKDRSELIVEKLVKP